MHKSKRKFSGILHKGFKPDKCKTSLRMAVARIKLLQNRKEVQVRQMRREVAQLLEANQDMTARIKILTESDETPADCATAVVNKDLFVYLQLQGDLNADAEREKLRKKKMKFKSFQLMIQMEATLLQRVGIFTGCTEPYCWVFDFVKL
ncbi:hypothetical protein Zm00014a_004370 [Zea mays]|uniref:Uncharacterized protein n=1 Tax=Zea mays TaxID=4577 RepID=A0A3L6FAY0_MAIZE|nr:hypothetical protein Zm00014a_004370 [Zea mays]